MCVCVCVYVFLVLDIQHAMSVRHYLINGTIFEKKNVTEHKMCVLIFSATFV